MRATYRLALAGTPAGGALLRWFETSILGSPDEPGAGLEALEDHRTDVLALPHLGGSRAAFADPEASGAIVGLRFATSRRDIVRALLDGVAYELAVILERFKTAGVEITSLRAVGGGSRSNVWLQTISDAVGLTVETTATSFAAALGAAAIARLGPGVDLDHEIVVVRETISPRAEWFDYHRTRSRRFRQLYSSLAAERNYALAPVG